MRAPRLPALLLLTFALPACSHTAPKSAEKAAPRSAVLRVENQTSYDVDVYLVRESSDAVRLGIVATSDTADLTFPYGLILGTQAHFIARSRKGVPGAGLTNDAKYGFVVDEIMTARDTMTFRILR